MNIHTSRLLLVPATADLVDLETAGNDALGQALSADVPANWPPEQVADALPWFLKQLKADPDLPGWLVWYALFRREAGELPLLVASGGFFGRPEDGTAEVGYSVLPQFQRQGYATEMVEGLVVWALSQPSVSRVVAETTADNAASLRVLHKSGFLPVGAGRNQGGLRFDKSGTAPK